MSDQVARLKNASVAELSDAVDQITGKQRVLDHRVRLLAGQRLFGPAVTIMVSETAERAAHTPGDTAIREAEPGAVVIAGVEDDLNAAVWGAAAYEIAAGAGLQGFVTDGSVREVEAAADSLAVFAAGRSPASGFGRLKIMAANIEITCGDVMVNPGDYVAGDADGVIILPKDRLTEIADALA